MGKVVEDKWEGSLQDRAKVEWLEVVDPTDGVLIGAVGRDWAPKGGRGAPRRAVATADLDLWSF